MAGFRVPVWRTSSSLSLYCPFTRKLPAGASAIVQNRAISDPPPTPSHFHRSPFVPGDPATEGPPTSDLCNMSDRKVLLVFSCSPTSGTQAVAGPWTLREVEAVLF